MLLTYLYLLSPLLRFFEDLEYIFLMIRENGIPMSSPVPKHPSNLVAAGKKISTVVTEVYLDCTSAVSQVAALDT